MAIEGMQVRTLPQALQHNRSEDHVSEKKETIRSLQDQRKKLVEQRDEARAALEAERQSPTLQLLQADKEALGRRVEELQSEFKLVDGRRSWLETENQEQRALVAEMLEKFTALKRETVAQKEHYDAELTKLRLDDVASLKKRLAQKAEELRLMTQARDQFQAAAEKLKHERDQAHAVLALIPKEVIQSVRESLQKPQQSHGPRVVR